jgi:hypothetical protein
VRRALEGSLAVNGANILNICPRGCQRAASGNREPYAKFQNSDNWKKRKEEDNFNIGHYAAVPRAVHLLCSDKVDSINQ